MAFSELSATCKDTSGTFSKPLQDKYRIYSPGTHYPDGTQVGRILIAGNTSRVSSSIAAPVAEKSQNFRVEFFLTHSLHLFYFPGILRLRDTELMVTCDTTGRYRLPDF
jgi:hypothetical protein